MANTSKLLITSASNYLAETTSATNSAYSIYTPTDTLLYISNDSISIRHDSNYVFGPKNRFPKKKKGSLIGTNNKSNRIKGLLKPIVVFKFVKSRFKPIEQRNLTKRLSKICELLENAHTMQQVALKEKISEKFGKLIREQEMLACGFDKCIKKEVLQAFVDSCDRRIIKITPLKNYVRVIPAKVRKIKQKADEKKLFDDYVVIHTDPNNTAVEKTEAEKKDPILCGIIKESDHYYFVADWEDELCNLTLDKILDQLELDIEDVKIEDKVEKSLLDALL